MSRYDTIGLCHICGRELETLREVLKHLCDDCRCEVPYCRASSAGEFGDRGLCIEHFIDAVELYKFAVYAKLGKGGSGFLNTQLARALLGVDDDCLRREAALMVIHGVKGRV